MGDDVRPLAMEFFDKGVGHNVCEIIDEEDDQGREVRSQTFGSMKRTRRTLNPVFTQLPTKRPRKSKPTKLDTSKFSTPTSVPFEESVPSGSSQDAASKEPSTDFPTSSPVSPPASQQEPESVPASSKGTDPPRFKKRVKHVAHRPSKKQKLNTPSPTSKQTTKPPSSSTRSTRSSGKPTASQESPSRTPQESKKQPKASQSTSTQSKPKSKTKKIPGFFGKAEIIVGKIVSLEDFSRYNAMGFVDKLREQGWEQILRLGGLRIYEKELREFFANCSVTDGVVKSRVNDQPIEFDEHCLGEILGIPSQGFDRYDFGIKNFSDMKKLVELVDTIGKGKDFLKGYAINKKVMEPMEQLFFMFLIKTLLPRGEGREYVNFRDLLLIDCFMKGEPINLPSLIINHIANTLKETKGSKIPYDVLLSLVFTFLDLEIGSGESMDPRSKFDFKMLKGCDFKDSDVGTVNKKDKGKAKLEEQEPSASAQGPPQQPASSEDTLQASASKQESDEVASLRAQIEFLTAQNASFTTTLQQVLARLPPSS